MPDDYRKYLDPATVGKLASLELKARLVVEGFIVGLHKSPYHGFSVEFADYRQYCPAMILSISIGKSTASRIGFI
jgi:hypothetical protein